MAADKLIMEALQIETELAQRLQLLTVIKRKVTALLDRKGRLTDYERIALASLIKLAKGEGQDD